jgi:hypothetical protein
MIRQMVLSQIMFYYYNKCKLLAIHVNGPFWNGVEDIFKVRDLVTETVARWRRDVGGHYTGCLFHIKRMAKESRLTSTGVLNRNYFGTVSKNRRFWNPVKQK